MRNIAAWNSGLKGIKKQITSKTLKRLERIVSKKNNLIIGKGPSIKVDKYQVKKKKKKDAVDLIIQLTGKRSMKKSLYINQIKEEGKIPLFKKDSDPNKILIDIQAAAILQLFKEGIQQHQINLNRVCTYSNSKLFNSYRRNKTNLK